jgi:FAD/FMN-containing dehydrogenase
MSTTLDNHLLDQLDGRVTGSVLAPDHPDYDTARAVHNGLVDRKPALIVRARSAQDVVAALAFARSGGFEVSVRGGGHNVAGRAVTDGGVMIDLAEMKNITVDPERGTATAQGGVTWNELNEAAAGHGLAVTGGAVSTTGIAGYTLGGGLGWLMGKYGLACDNLEAVELVTAAGDVLEVDADSYPELLWALRGGGGNFGVATSFTYRLHPLKLVTGGLIAHPVDAAPDLLRFYRDAVVKASDDLTVFAGLVHAPDGSGAKLAALVVCHAGDPDTAAQELAPFLSFGSPVMTQVGPMPYPQMNTLLDAGYPTGSLNYWLSSFTRGLPDALIDAVLERFASVPSTMTAILLEHFHGAVTRVGPTDTAVPHREPGWNLLIPSVWTDPAATDANIRWTRDTHTALSPHLAAGRWLNYLGDDQANDAVQAAYGPNYDRLREIKHHYDPANVFHHNHNIAP